MTVKGKAFIDQFGAITTTVLAGKLRQWLSSSWLLSILKPKVTNWARLYQIFFMSYVHHIGAWGYTKYASLGTCEHIGPPELSFWLPNGSIIRTPPPVKYNIRRLLGHYLYSVCFQKGQRNTLGSGNIEGVRAFEGIPAQERRIGNAKATAIRPRYAGLIIGGEPGSKNMRLWYDDRLDYESTPMTNQSPLNYDRLVYESTPMTSRSPLNYDHGILSTLASSQLRPSLNSTDLSTPTPASSRPSSQFRRLLFNCHLKSIFLYCPINAFFGDL
ncbi:hypothetical protein BJ508DRAFT_309916 [Ascobolus immersus RN42]|uniref:Uncharacterized protein n=1 Tax=Ascobolus immersus RN42 TaxID=1160509 RepID=A0A3N4HYX9_ASCIM|nr:hypothetical protein BJ508DRAFT_309916 [Ascobolus immersus RN42]